MGEQLGVGVEAVQVRPGGGGLELLDVGPRVGVSLAVRVVGDGFDAPQRNLPGGLRAAVRVLEDRLVGAH